jgi:DNA-binding response OmpR family regulator
MWISVPSAVKTFLSTPWTKLGGVLMFNKCMGEHLRATEVPVMVRILLADSEPHIRWLLQEELEDEGYEVLVTGRGGEVARLVDAYRPDVVVLEIRLDDMSGLETGRIVKGTRKKTRVVYFSHCRPPQDLSSWGGDEYVFKSPNLDRLKKVVHRLALAA